MFQNQCKRKKIVLLTGGLIFSVLFSFGYTMEKYETCKMTTVFPLILCLFPLMTITLSFLLKFTSSLTPSISQNSFSFRASFITFIIIILSWTPMYLIMFPGVFCVDTGNQLAQITLGLYSTHHPLLHTLLLKFCIDMIPFLGSLNRCAALYSTLQMFFLAGCFTLTISSISRSASVRAAKWSILFFALHPLHMIYAVSCTKDVLFTGVFVLFLSLCIEYITADSQPHSIGLLIGITICGILSTLLRNNMIYALIAWLPILMITLRKKHLRFTLCIALTIPFTLFINNALQNITQAQSGDIREMLSWPIQQLARVRLYEEEHFTNEEKELLDQLILKQKWVEYDPRISDPVKGAVDSKVLLSNLKEYINLYLSIGQRSPQAYLDAVVALCYPLFYPYQTYNGAFDYVEVGIDPTGFDQCYGQGRVSFNTRFSSARDWLETHLWKDGASTIPLIDIVFNMGLIVWIVLYFAIQKAYLGNWKQFGILLLPILLWGTFLLGPIIYSRYAYPFLSCLPVLAARPRGEQ